MSEPDLLVLHTLRLRGLVSADALVDATAIEPGEVTELLAKLTEQGLVKHRAGARMAGYALTADGKREHATRIVAPSPELESAYTAFIPLNTTFKELCTAWQTREGGPNDHTDADYDGAVIARLGALHPEICAAADGAAAAVPRFRTYSVRFAAALERLRGGENAAFARPLTGSYHDVWMELHQDLLLTLGRERAAADGH